MNKVIFLHSVAKEEIYAILYIEKKLEKDSCMINIFSAPKESEFRLVLTDQYGETHFETFLDETRVFCLPRCIDTDGEILAELFINDKVMLIGSSEELANGKGGIKLDGYIDKQKEVREGCRKKEQKEFQLKELDRKRLEEESSEKEKLCQEDFDKERFNQDDLVEEKKCKDNLGRETGVSLTEKEKVEGKKSFLDEANYYINLIKQIQSREQELDESIYKADYVLGQEKKEYMIIDNPVQINDKSFPQDDDNYSKKQGGFNDVKKFNIMQDDFPQNGKNYAKNFNINNDPGYAPNNVESFQQNTNNYSEKQKTENGVDNINMCQVENLDKVKCMAGCEISRSEQCKMSKQVRDKDMGQGEFLYKKEPCNNNKFYFKIAFAFETLFSIGRQEYILTNKFKNSEFRRVEVNGENFVLGKIYDAASVTRHDLQDEKTTRQGYVEKSNVLSPRFNLPCVVVIGKPVIRSSRRVNNFGENSIFLSNGKFDEFGFELLFCDSDEGRACFCN